MRIFGIVALGLLAACGGAHAATRGFEVSDFTRLRVEGPFDVRVRTGIGPAARATGPQAAIDRVIVEQHGDTLVIRPVRSAGGVNWSWGKDQPMVIEVGTHRIDAATIAGSGDVAIDRARGDSLDLTLGGSGDLSVEDVDVATLRLAMNGSGDLTVKGRARQADALLVGSGDIHGEALQADTATAKLVGSGDLALAARRTAAVTLSGSGDVTITGPASCTVSRTGSGDVHCGRGGAPN
jgi:hypothetical protein